MPAKVELRLNRSLRKWAKGRFEQFDFAVGVLDDGPHRKALYGKLKSYAGGPARKIGKRIDGTLSGVSEKVRKESGINIYTLPFKNTRKNANILKFTTAFFQLCFGRVDKKRATNLLQAVVRNPILRGDYGKNSSVTAKIKGFNRLFIDTGQLFKAIKATVRKKKNVS